MRKALLTSLLGFVMVLGLASAAFALYEDPFWAYSEKAIAGKPYFIVDPSMYTTYYNSGVTYSSLSAPAQVAAPTGAGSTQVHATFNVILKGDAWTSNDTLTVQLWNQNTNTMLKSLVTTGINPLTGNPYSAIYFDLYGTYTGGDYYYITALSNTANGPYRVTAESLSLETSGVDAIRGTDRTAVPLPAAVWILGSGLLGVAGFKRRMRNKTAA